MKTLLLGLTFLLSLHYSYGQQPFISYPFDNMMVKSFGIDNEVLKKNFMSFDSSNLNIDYIVPDSLRDVYADSLVNSTGASSNVYTAVCDSFGQIACWYDGRRLYNHNIYQRITNQPTYFWNTTGGEFRLKECLLLPWPGQEHSKAVFLYNHLPYETLEGAPTQYVQIWGDSIGVKFKGISIDYMGIDLEDNNGLGSVFIPPSKIIEDTLIGIVSVQVVRHANGRDWWAWFPRLNSNQYYKVLIDPNGLHNLGLFENDSIFYVNKQNNLSLTSLDGNFLYYMSSTNRRQQITEFAIDRCNGDLSFSRSFVKPLNEADIPVTQSNTHVEWYMDMQISPNGRFLYFNKIMIPTDYDTDSILRYVTTGLLGTYLLQLDTWTAPPWNPPLDTIGFDVIHSDSLKEYRPNFGFLAPNNKIYYAGYPFGGSNGPESSPYAIINDEGMCVVNYPNRKGLASGFGFETRLRGETPYYYPNYDLGPLDGSSCDTLGLDNYPKAIFDYSYDDLHTLAFEDYSVLNLTSWSWSFGDGFGSEEQFPTHYYAADGSYTVCLTVANEYGSDEFCRTVQIGVSTGIAEEVFEAINISPNPFQAQLNVTLPDGLPNGLYLRLYGITGQFIRQWSLAQTGTTAITLPDLPTGQYAYEILLGKQKLKAGVLQKNGE